MTLEVLKPQIFCPDEPKGIIIHKVVGGSIYDFSSIKAPNILF